MCILRAIGNTQHIIHHRTVVIIFYISGNYHRLLQDKAEGQSTINTYVYGTLKRLHLERSLFVHLQCFLPLAYNTVTKYTSSTQKNKTPLNQ